MTVGIGRWHNVSFVLALLTWLFAAVGAPTTTAQEPARLALLIGNKSYTAKVGPLKNPHTDVDLVEASLKRLGFKVTVVKDATYKQMDTALKRYVTDVRRAGRGALSFFYYSGHGVANPENGLNYLIPVDVADADDDKVWFESFQQNVVIDMLSKQAPGATHYLVFDACRNELNVSGTNAKALGADKGFVPVADTAGLLIAYATAPKRTASDAGDGGGPYAKVLAEELVKPGVESVTMFRNVQIRVKQSIGQDPWLSFPSLPPVYLAGLPEAPPSAKQPEPPISEAAQAWRRIEGSKDVRDFEAFRQQFGRQNPYYDRLAEQAIASLAPVAPVAPATPAPALPTKQAAIVPPAPPRCAGIETVVLGTKRCLEPGNTITECQGCPEMVVVPGGSFMMGSPDSEEGRDQNEGPQRRVAVKAFAVGRFEVTFAEWDACVADGGCKRKPGDQGWGRGRRPVIDVSWNDAKTYVAWIAAKTGAPYRLLTEAEWEYAARAGTTTPFHFGPTISSAQANYNGTLAYASGAQGVYRQRTIEVGSLNTPNAFGLHDVHGNVWEWVEDCYADSYAKAPTDRSKAPDTTGCSRVLRGGSWNDYHLNLRSAFRNRNPPVGRLRSFGFRLARTLSPTPATTTCHSLTPAFAPLTLAPGDTLCDTTGRHTATVEQIADRVIRFTQSQGEPFSCRTGEDCRFAWAGAPVFRVEAEADTARGIAPRGTIRPK